MSIKLMNAAWDSGVASTTKMVLLSICDNANEEGQAFLLVKTIAKKCGMDRATIYRHIAELERLGCIARRARPGRSSIFLVYASKFPEAPADDGEDFEPVANCDPSHPATSPVANCDTYPSQIATPLSQPATHNHLLTLTTPKKGAVEDKPAKKATPKRAKSSEITLTEFLDQCDDADVEYIPGTDPIFEYATTIGLSREMVLVAWHSFEQRYATSTKRYADWRAAFRNAIRGNWLKLWYRPADSSAFRFTTAGEQAMLEARAAKAIA